LLFGLFTFLTCPVSRGHNNFIFWNSNLGYGIPDEPPVWPDTIKLNPTTIHASRLVDNPMPGVYPFSPQFIKTMGEASLGRILSYSGLIHIKNYGPGNLMTATARGLPATHTGVEWNGIPIVSLSTGQVDFSMVPLSPNPDIVILTGTQAQRGGKFSPGGMITIQTNGLFARKENPEIALCNGSFGEYKVQASLPYQRKSFGARIGVNYARAENDFPYTDPFSGEKLNRIDAGYHSLSIMADGSLKSKNHLLGIHVWTQNHFRKIPRPIISVQLPGNEWMKQDALRFALSDHWLRGNLECETTAGYTYDFFFYRNLSGNIRSTMATHQPLFLQLTTLRLDKLTLQSNLKIIHQQAVSANYANNPQRTSLQAGVHANKGLSHWLEIGAHFDIEKNAKMPLQYHPLLKIEVFNRSQRNFRAHISAGKTSRIPSFNDLYWIPGGNPELKPEKIWTGELGLSLTPRLLPGWNSSFSLVLYNNWVENWILWLPDSVGTIWTASNLGKVDSKGIEVHSFFSTEKIQLNATANLNSVYESDKKNYQLPYSPQFQFSVLGIYHAGPISFHSLMAYTSKRYLDKDNLSSLPGYWVMDAGLSFEKRLKLHALEIRLDIKNVLNKKYEVVAWQPMPGRNYWFSVIYKFNRLSTDYEKAPFQ